MKGSRVNDFHDLTRVPQEVVNGAIDQWCTWHPGDGTSYRVRIVPVVGGPNDGAGILLVTVTGVVSATMFYGPNHHHFQSWTKSRWSKSQLNPPGGYDWWPQVVQPLLSALGVAK